ncbi:MAG: TetR/AcrR family transcriptional regulator [Elusimicrobia bacterium]|nr:TetR/AcrR family transcriptional regulator [Elusimicrobiota bacterium]
MRPAAASAKKDAILAATRRLLVERGFQDLTLDEVARAAGVAKGTLFLYYKSKDALFSAAFGDLVDQLGGRLDELLASDRRGRALLAETARAILSHHDRNRDFMAHFGAGRFPACGARSAERLMDKFRENGRRVTRILQRCAEDGLLPAGDFVYESAALFGLCRSAMLEKLIRGSAGRVEDQTDKVLGFFLHGARGKA